MLSSSCKKNDNKNPPKTGTVTDIEGNIYVTVKIGNQWWMAENLRATRFNDSTPIPLVTDSAAWGKFATPACCYYNNDASGNKKVYGPLYNWYAVKTGKLAPAGWHVPTLEEWNILVDNYFGYTWAGEYLREEGNIHWNASLSMANNKSGFTALPGGERENDGSFYGLHNRGGFWSSTTSGDVTVKVLLLRYDNIGVDFIDYHKFCGLSVRCIKD